MMDLPFNLRDELTKLRKLELAALKADNAVLRQRIKIFPPVEQAVGRLFEQMKDQVIHKAIIKADGNILKASRDLGLSRSGIYKRLRKINGHLAALIIWWMLLTGCVTNQQPPSLPVRSLMESSITLPPPTARVTLEWDPSPSTNIISYLVYWGVQTRTYTNQVTTTELTVTLTNLIRGEKYFFAATAKSQGGESVFSDELVYTVPESQVRIILWTAPFTSGPWAGILTNTLPATNTQQYFKQSIQLVP